MSLASTYIMASICPPISALSRVVGSFYPNDFELVQVGPPGDAVMRIAHEEAGLATFKALKCKRPGPNRRIDSAPTW